MRPLRGIVQWGLVSVLAWSATGSARPDAPLEEGWLKTPSEHFESIEAGGTVRVVNPHGNVYARFGGYEHRVEVLATDQRPAEESPGLKLELRRRGPGLDVSVGPAAPGASPIRGRIDLVVFVPQGAPLEVRTDAGSIEVKGLKSDVSASSIKGDLHVVGVRGAVRAKSERGNVAATLETGVTEAEQDLSTVTGDIEVWLWEDADLDARIETSGVIGTDFSLKVEHRDLEEPSKRAVASVGEGGPALLLSSKRGAVKLLRLPRGQGVRSSEEEPD